MRGGEPTPAAVQEIWRGSQFDRLDLQPLSLDETTTLLSATLGGSVDPDAAQRLWTLTRGNMLYLRNIVEQEVAEGRLEMQHGYWRWTGDPIVAPGLVELIESRIGDLPAPVADVIDALAVGEPIELAALTRITDPAAVEEADTRGLITLEPVVGGVEVRVAHPLYGEVRRKRAAPTRLRRLRGLVAAELAASDDRDDARVVVRRATLSLDSDLTPDADLLVRAANGAVWLADLPLAERLAEAAIRADAGPEANFVRAHALSWLSRGEEADTVLAEIRTSQLTDADHARFAFLRASNMLWVLADPVRAKELIHDASSTASPQARSYIDAFLTVYWFAMDQPGLATQASKDLAVDELPAVVDAEMLGRSLPSPRMRGAPPKRWPSQTRDTSLRRALSTLRRCGSTSLMHTSAHCCCPAGFGTPSMWPSGCASRQPISRGRRTCSVLRWRVGPHLVQATWIPHVCCWSRRRRRCPPRAMPSAGDTVITSHARQPSPCGVQPARQPPRLPRSISCGVLFGCWTLSGAWPGRGWPLARAR